MFPNDVSNWCRSLETILNFGPKYYQMTRCWAGLQLVFYDSVKIWETMVSWVGHWSNGRIKYHKERRQFISLMHHLFPDKNVPDIIDAAVSQSDHKKWCQSGVWEWAPMQTPVSILITSTPLLVRMETRSVTRRRPSNCSNTNSLYKYSGWSPSPSWAPAQLTDQDVGWPARHVGPGVNNVVRWATLCSDWLT